ncbi:AAA domain-containing protein, putative AbiEii toxin, Type IV TA system [Ruminococcaceae bacterium FB2012]|nr:AAA domain-containing protein, putative AbiEii toxin, Type IV TA system [Ruminococcaceae bacterium FB2012]
MNLFNINSQVNHITFGRGTVVDIDETFMTVAFEDGSIKRFLSDDSSALGFFDSPDNETSADIKIERIVIKRLFGRIDYDIVINNSNVSILSAPNGCGKTTIFKFLDFVLNPRMASFNEIKHIPFYSFSCYLSNGMVLNLNKVKLESDNLKKTRKSISPYNVAMSLFNNPFDITFWISGKQDNPLEISLIKTLIEEPRNGTTFLYEDDEPDYVVGHGFVRIKRWFNIINSQLIKFNCKVSIDFIEANRLQKEYDVSMRARLSRNDRVHGLNNPKLERDSERDRVDYLYLANDKAKFEIRKCMQEYNRRLTEAKNVLPSMYIQAPDQTNFGFDSFQARWNRYHEELNKFYEIGFLNSKETVIETDDLENSYNKKASFLETYLKAFEDTIEPLQKHYDKMKLFADIFNKRNEITQKTIKFTEDGIKVFIDNKDVGLKLENLSSGEKNDFVMFYRLIFDAAKNGIVLIDEPEISLHIEWQEEYLDRLIDICKMNNLQAIVATHSPNIVNGHFDLFVNKR